MTINALQIRVKRHFMILHSWLLFAACAHIIRPIIILIPFENTRVCHFLLVSLVGSN